MKCKIKDCPNEAKRGGWIVCKEHATGEPSLDSDELQEKPQLDHIPTWGEMMSAAKRNHNTAQAILDQRQTDLQRAQFDLEEAQALEAEARKVYEYVKTLKEQKP